MDKKREDLNAELRRLCNDLGENDADLVVSFILSREKHILEPLVELKNNYQSEHNPLKHINETLKRGGVE